jgi:hypothetical protein
MKNLLFAAGLLLVTGCGSDNDKDEDFTCALGELTGTWRWHYDETDGNCGAIADETAIFQPGAAPPPGCQIDTQIVSSDKCRLDSAFTCPTADDMGVQGWTLVLHHVAADRLGGTGTAQLNHPTIGTCRSTYNITVTRL